MRKVLAFVRETLDEVTEAAPSEYRSGCLDMLRLVEEFIEDSLWEMGEQP